jgi:flagellar basal-body rod protein FlgC
MSFFESMDILSSGLSAERVRINTTSSNMANAQTTRTEEGGPYRRRDPIFLAASSQPEAFASEMQDAMQSVTVTDIVKDTGAPRMVYNPKHPDANADGYVGMPNVNMVEEMVNMLTASRSYEAEVTAMHGLVGMAEKALGLGR